MKNTHETPMTECLICGCYKEEDPKVVATIRSIDNALLPHSDRAPKRGDRRTRLETIISKLDWKHLTQDQQDSLRELILNNNNLFILDDTELGRLKVPEAHITTIDEEPVRMPLYRHPAQARQIISEMLDNMLEKDVIEESTAAYLSLLC